jgi:Zn-dependent protease
MVIRNCFENFGQKVFYTRFRVARIGELRVSVHWTWFLYLVLWMYISQSAYSTWLWRAAQFVGVFLLVLAHEFGHVVAAKHLKFHVAEIILWPLGGLAVFNAPRPWREELLVTIAGPASNLLLIPVTFLSWYFFAYRLGGDVSALLWNICWANVFIFLLNLFPVFPLDGGRALHSLLFRYMQGAGGRLVSSVAGIAFATIGTAWAIHMHQVLLVVFLSALTVLNATLLPWLFTLLATERRFGIHPSAACPYCQNRAIAGPIYRCRQCGMTANPFASGTMCWQCGSEMNVLCQYCGEVSDAACWFESVNHRGLCAL